jgi:hypothetical protein
MESRRPFDPRILIRDSSRWAGDAIFAASTLRSQRGLKTPNIVVAKKGVRYARLPPESRGGNTCRLAQTDAMTRLGRRDRPVSTFLEFEQEFGKRCSNTREEAHFRQGGRN